MTAPPIDGPPPQQKTRSRFVFLDGLRGLAALAVLLFHLGAATGATWVFPHGYLAVDLFFCLSGFVLAHAYQARLRGGLRLREFVWLRWVRLWPMVFASMTLGAAYGFAKVAVNAPGADDVRGVITAYLLGVLMIPTVWDHHASYYDRIFPLNGPAWSLFFEIFANLAWAAVATRLTTFRLAAITAIFGALLLVSAITHGSIEVGPHAETFWLGFPRVFFSFGAGLLVHRLYASGKLGCSAPAWSIVAALLVILAAPSFQGQALFEFFVIGVGFPALVLLGANHLDPQGPSGRACELSGALSYPVYALHFPLLDLTAGLLQQLGYELTFAVGVLAVLPIILMSYAALRVFDEPLRRRFIVWRGGAKPSPRARAL